MKCQAKCVIELQDDQRKEIMDVFGEWYKYAYPRPETYGWGIFGELRFYDGVFAVALFDKHEAAQIEKVLMKINKDRKARP